jgi:hypothetical protein
MMNSLVERILKSGSPLSIVLASSTGCFVLMRGSRLIAMESDGSDSSVSLRTDDRLSRPLAGLSAALFLMAFAASEALVMIRALCR